jgi:hypothetical protein
MADRMEYSESDPRHPARQAEEDVDRYPGAAVLCAA